MKKAFLLTIAFLLIISLTNIANADQLQMDNEWDTGMYTADIEKDTSNNYYFAGDHLAEGGSSTCAVVMKYDENHNLIYSKSFEDLDNFVSISLDNEGCQYLLGYDFKHFFYDPANNISEGNEDNILQRSHIIKLDNNGNQVFDLNLDEGNNSSEFLGIKVYDNFIYAVGRRDLIKNHIRREDEYEIYDVESAFYLVKIDLDGNIISETILGEKVDKFEGICFNDFAESAAYIYRNFIN